MDYALIPVVFIVAMAYFFRQKFTTQNPPEPSVGKQTTLEENIYPELRNMAFLMTKDRLQLTGDCRLYGMVIEWDMGGAFMTVAAFRTGDTSLYLSNGGAVIGGGKHQTIRDAVAHLMSRGEEALSKAKRVEHSDLPKGSEVNFYFLTTEGRFLIVDNIESLDNESSPQSTLFMAGNDIITEYRLVQQN